MSKGFEKACFMEFKRQAKGIRTEEDLIAIEKQFRRFSDCFGEFKATIEDFLTLKHSEFKNARLDALIRPFEPSDAFVFNLQGLEHVEKKIDAIQDAKLKNAFNGVLNLLNERSNLVYNKLWTRQALINDLNKFKTLKFFKVAYVSAFDLRKDYRYLAVKGDAQKFHSQIIPIEHGLFVLKTLETDGISLKAFYINKKINVLLEKDGRVHNLKKAVPRGRKFNKSSVDAWKTLEKEDNIRFYGYCNRAGLDKKNRQLLKAIRQKQGGETFSCYLEGVEARKSKLEGKFDELATITCENGVVLTNYEYLDELDAVTRKYWYLTEEHNSDDVPTDLGDYEW